MNFVTKRATKLKDLLLSLFRNRALAYSPKSKKVIESQFNLNKYDPVKSLAGIKNGFFM